MRIFRGALLLGGLALLACGLTGLLTDPYVTGPLGVLLWAAGLLVLHDGLWLPLVCAVGAAVAGRPVLRGWLVVVAAVGAVAVPAVLRAGDDHGNPTLLPLPYLRNWLLFLAVGAAVAALTAVVRRGVRRARRAGR
ncbi:hypothetical protein K353_00906 [Kitasatospora sp. SolWspMP-SS2h]|uniref:hypothetical protein n=1 Tax=Kitasatospora sp. SolWspMP-SS2h TaxID=1305729 RepID=UPI000DB922BF|nr:hypothetical protein [Kitasatospora sp. SolWspMP-SS2h]RAJ45408.1 hypothetical protein K353_00906 [Kitasatospora sp. SolWspMP-SS2h]